MFEARTSIFTIKTKVLHIQFQENERSIRLGKGKKNELPHRFTSQEGSLFYSST